MSGTDFYDAIYPSGVSDEVKPFGDQEAMEKCAEKLRVVSSCYPKHKAAFVEGL